MNVVRLNRATAAPTRSQQITLGMAQLSPFGLSEQWLLRDCGDRHWALIAETIGGTMAFRDTEGHPVYAAFCATEVTYGAAPNLGQQIRIQSALFHVAKGRIGSEHTITGASGEIAQIRMITCFLRHDQSRSNTKLLRSGLEGLSDLPDAPETLQQLHASARETARAARLTKVGKPMLTYTPVPELDFNAVGLLYFPVFTKIAQMARPASRPAGRQVVYLGNLNQGETISVSTCPRGLLLHSGNRLIGCVGAPQGL